MNMLANKIPFGLLSEDDKELFRKYISSCYVLQVNGGFCAFLSGASINQTHTFRIKLKESEWYKVSDNRKANPVIVQYTPDSKVDGCFENGTKSDSFYGKDEITAIRPATQAEIDSVKPEESFVDVKLNYSNGMIESNHPKLDKIYNISAKPIGWTLSGWVLSGYVFDNVACPTKSPIMFNADGADKIYGKATHARFCKVSV